MQACRGLHNLCCVYVLSSFPPAVLQVVDAVGVSDADSSPPLLPPLKRRNSGKRNLHKPWTSTEEETLVKLVDQADFRKAVCHLSVTQRCQWQPCTVTYLVQLHSALCTNFTIILLPAMYASCSHSMWV